MQNILKAILVEKLGISYGLNIPANLPMLTVSANLIKGDEEADTNQ